MQKELLEKIIKENSINKDFIVLQDIREVGQLYGHFNVVIVEKKSSGIIVITSGYVIKNDYYMGKIYTFKEKLEEILKAVR